MSEHSTNPPPRVTTVLLDTNTLLSLRAYNLAKLHEDEYCMRLFKEQSGLSDLIDSSPENNLIFYTSEMSVVEMKVSHIKYHLYDFATQSYKIPVDVLYDKRANALNGLRDDFNKKLLKEKLKDFSKTINFRHINVLPGALSEAENISWRRRQEILFQLILEYETFEAQDAYIVTSAMAYYIDEIWTSDGYMRSRINDLRKHQGEFRTRVSAQWRNLFDRPLILPRSPAPKEIREKYTAERTLD